MSKASPEYNKKMKEVYEEDSYQSQLQNRTRARTVTCGPCGGGSIEISMRGDFGNLWIPLRPTEVVEFLEQLAASIGVEIAMRPKQNFSAWRAWHDDDTASAYWKGSADWELQSQKEQRAFRSIEVESELEKRKQMLALQSEYEVKQFAGELFGEQKQLEPQSEQTEEPSPKPSRKRRSRT